MNARSASVLATSLATIALALMIGACSRRRTVARVVDPMCWSCRRSQSRRRGAHRPPAQQRRSDGSSSPSASWPDRLRGRQLVPIRSPRVHMGRHTESWVWGACSDRCSSHRCSPGTLLSTPVAMGLLGRGRRIRHDLVRCPLLAFAHRVPGRSQPGRHRGDPRTLDQGGIGWALLLVALVASAVEPRAPIPQGRWRGTPAAEVAGVVSGPHRDRLAPARGDLLGRRAPDAHGMAWAKSRSSWGS